MRRGGDLLWSENGKKSSAVCQGSERAGPEGWTSASRCQPGSRLSEHPFGYRMGRFEQHQAQGAGRIKPKLKPHFGIQERKGRVCLCNALTLTKTNTVTSLLMYSSPRFLQKWLQSGKVAGSCHWVEPRQSRWLQRQLQVAASAAAIYLLPSAKEKLPLPGQTPSSKMKPTLLHHFTPAPRFWRLKGNLFTRRHVPSPRPAGIITTTFVHPLQHPEKKEKRAAKNLSHRFELLCKPITLPSRSLHFKA